MPPICIMSRGPKPSEDNVPSTSIMPNTIAQAGNLLSLQFSRNTETIASASDIDEVSAAKKTSTKNTAPIHLPPGMLLNTAGS